MTDVREQPPPPPLRKDIERLVFTHKSLFGKPASMIEDTEDPQDWERVAFLGEGIMLAAMSRVLYSTFPRHRTSWLKPRRTQLLSKESLASITADYNFMEKLRCLEPSRQNIARSLDNRAALAESFVGGIALEYGMEKARRWAEEVLAWKHGLKLPFEEGGELGAGMVSEGKEVVMQDVSPVKGFAPVGAMAAPPPPAPAVPPAFSMSPLSTTYTPPQPLYQPPPQETPKWEFGIPVQQPSFNPYQAPHPEVTSPVQQSSRYNAGNYYTQSSFRPLPQPTPHAVPAASPPLDQLNFKHSNPSFYDTAMGSYMPPQSPPKPQPPTVQPFSSPAKPVIPTWPASVPGATSLPTGAPTSSGPKAVPGDEKMALKAEAALASQPTGGGSTTTTTTVLGGFGTLAKLNEQAQKRCQKLQWEFSSVGQGQYITWTASLLVRGDVVAQGQGQSKQIAKEITAQRALEALGWK